jgi:hypothetical protein
VFVHEVRDWNFSMLIDVDSAASVTTPKNVTVRSRPNGSWAKTLARLTNSAPAGLRWDRRLMTNSASRPGTPTSRMMARETTRNALPPFSAVIHGKRQMFPDPTALPTAATMKPTRVRHDSRVIATHSPTPP